MAKQLHVCFIKKSYVKLNTKQSITMARMNPKGVLGGEKPRLIDEWQKAPDIWNQVKDDLDFEYQFGKYILTGSSTPADKTEVHHSGAGRITPVKMRPMSLWESKESKGTISLMDLFDGKNNYPWDMNDEISLNDIAFLICRGGWPISVQAPKEIAIEITKNYYNGLFVFEDCRIQVHAPPFMRHHGYQFSLCVRCYALSCQSTFSVFSSLWPQH